MKLNNKITTLVASLLAVSSLSADITFGTVNGTVLGGMGLKNYQTDDVYNIWVNPAYIIDYKNTAVLDLGINNDPTSSIGTSVSAAVSDQTGILAGATYDLGNFGVIGVWSGRSNLSGMSTMLNNYDTRGVQSEPITTDIFYAIAVSDFKIGTRLTLATNSQATGEGVSYNAYTNASNYSKTAVSDNYTMSEIGAEVGVVMGSLPIAATVGIHLPGVDSTENTGRTTTVVGGVTSIVDNGTTTVSSDNLNFNANVQYSPMIGKAKFITTAYYNYESADVTQGNLDADVDGTTSTSTSNNNVATVTDGKHTLGLDLAMNFHPFEKTKAVIAIGYTLTNQTITKLYTTTTTLNGATTYNGSDLANDDTETENYTSSFPISVGFEQNATTNLTLRAGGTMALSVTSDSTVTTTKNVLNSAGTGSEALYSTSSTTNSLTNSTASIHVGFSYAMSKDLGIHSVINKNILISGPNFIGGSVNDLSLNASLIYTF